MKVQVEYFAQFREAAGKDRELLDVLGDTAFDVWNDLVARYGIHPGRDSILVAVNDDFSDWNRKLSEGDRIVFLPPVSGG